MSFFGNNTNNTNTTSNTSAPPLPVPDSSSSSDCDDPNRMTVTRALVELKTMDKRIQKEIDRAMFVTVEGQMQDPDPRIDSAQSSWDRIQDLMERRVKCKSAIVSSNAQTRVRICGRDLTVAEAIEMKTSIKNHKSLLGNMKTQYGQAVQKVERENERARRNFENQVTRNDSSNNKDNSNTNDKYDYEERSEKYMKVHKVRLCDPLKLQEKMERQEQFISDFEREVDFILSEKNSTTYIAF